MTTLGLRGALALSLAFLPAACGAPPPPPPTVVKLQLSAADDVNPGPDGRAAPIVLRVYQLASDAGFAGATFYQLYNSDSATLKTDIVKRDDFQLAPSEAKGATLMPTDMVQAIGVMGAFRDFQHVAWRGAVTVPAHKTSTVTVRASLTGVVVKIERAAPAKASD